MKLGAKAAFAAATLSAALCLTACGGSAAGPDAAGTAAGAATKTVKAMTIGSLADAKSFDPVDARTGHAMPIFQTVYDTLLLRDRDGKISPMLATKWEYNADNTVLTLTLRDGVTFSDGTPFDAAAVKANMDNFKAVKGQDAYQVNSVKEVAVVDPRTVTITLNAADPAFEYYLTLAAGFMASPKALGTPELKTDPRGSGPYVLDKANSVKGSQYVFTKRDGYWNKDLQKFEKVTIKILTDATARTNALVSGQIDAALLDPKNGKQAEGAGMKLNKSQVDWTGIFLYDRDGKISPELANVKVRQAINHAFDRKTIKEQQFLGQGTETTQIFGPESGAYVPDLDNRYPYDPEKAKKLLAEAGYPNGFTIKYPTTAGSDSLNAVYAQQLADIGIKLELETIPQPNLVADMAAGKYAAGSYSLFQAGPWVSITQIIGQSALYNPFKTTTPELESLISEVQNGGEKSSELAKKVNTYVTENAWFAPILRLDQMYYTGKNVNVKPQAHQAVPSIYNYEPAK
ncbi:ABC transporter substrate-binding protein [Arthrobacter nitrophenolicus]|uniref:ABC transporter substrate-binding protein n=1 Tax=Arthrobacter nitrophenolicus TaxID=683150 RepID=A0A4R5Y5C6_9MICC|nr:ABC transporter substrate-binding protein [Arthrobacter nitrophenolicus]TDL39703.1 ABC transporter substrate-binding protein [Arthrobacter nitrophenolicus]